MINITQGDTPVLSLTATDGLGNPINLTGASFSTQILGPLGVIVTIGNSAHTIVNAVLGQFTVALTAVQTAALGLGPNKDILTTVTISGNITTYRGAGILQVLPSVPIA